MKAVVHTNEALTILPQLFKQPHEWGDHRFPLIQGTCLLLQVIYAVEIQTGIDAKKIAAHFKKQQISAGCSGVSLEQLALALPPLLKGRELGALRHKTITSAINAMKTGSTVVGIFSADDDLDVAFSHYHTGIIPRYYVKKARGPGVEFLHSLMMAGVDEKERHVIFRDSRPEHHWRMKGFAKYPIAPLIRNNKAMAYVELVVH